MVSSTIVHGHILVHSVNRSSSSLTGYDHLECNRRPIPSCLDGTEICDRKVDCLDGGENEEYCWKLGSNECQEDEYQCIPKSFLHEKMTF